VLISPELRLLKLPINTDRCWMRIEGVGKFLKTGLFPVPPWPKALDHRDSGQSLLQMGLDAAFRSHASFFRRRS